MFDASDVVKTYGGVRALDGVSLSAGEGAVVGILGPNGSGKTTFFNMATGFGKPASGTFRFDGTDITGWPAHRIAKLGIIRTFQNLRLFRDMTCLENVLVGAHRSLSGSFVRGVVNGPGERRRERQALDTASRLLHQVGLETHRGNYAANLSYGQMKRLEIARAMAAQPRLLLLDEPAAGINDTQANEVLGLVGEIAAQSRTTILMVEHNVQALLAVATDVYVFDAGTVVFHGPPDEVRSSPEVIEAYLGDEED